uniref:Inhibitor I9 domain-containing protein n=1 Tax=Ananas comosus var. bracteatus TaxID=296719 RepID=A0A6V7QNT4_ANACO|nr:unnamed protein product [Ananas comosus var. bracteatus]
MHTHIPLIITTSLFTNHNGNARYTHFSPFITLSSSYSLRAADTAADDDRDRLATYIVHVQPPKSAPAFATVDEQKSWYKSFLPSGSADDRLVHAYTTVVTGFAARLSPKELDDASKMPGFVAAYPDQL